MVNNKYNTTYLCEFKNASRLRIKCYKKTSMIMFLILSSVRSNYFNFKLNNIKLVLVNTDFQYYICKTTLL